jgi:hypothetical protein
MHNSLLDWLDTLPDLRVPGVPAQKSAVSAGTPRDSAGVPGVPEQERNTSEHRLASQGVPAKPLKVDEEHPEHLGTPKTCKQGFGDLPLDLLEGLARLRVMARPSIARAEVWTAVVSDALWLAEAGCALQALKLGWGAGELFGVSADAGWQSLAVWLDGRRHLLIGEHTAFVDKGGWRAIYNRRVARNVTMLWEIDRGLAERSR